MKNFWPGHKHEGDQVTDTVPSFAFTGPVILEEIEEQRAASSALRPLGVLRRAKSQIASRVRPLLTRINTAAAIPNADSVPRISSATSHGSIDIPEVEDLPQLLTDDQEGSSKTVDDPLANLFPSLVNLYLDENIRPLPSPVPFEAVPLFGPPPLSQVSSRLPSSEATSVYSSDRYFSSTDSLGGITPSSSTTPLAGSRTWGKASGKSKKERYGVEGKLVGWVRGLWRRGFGGLMS